MRWLLLKRVLFSIILIKNWYWNNRVPMEHGIFDITLKMTIPMMLIPENCRKGITPELEPILYVVVIQHRFIVMTYQIQQHLTKCLVKLLNSLDLIYIRQLTIFLPLNTNEGNHPLPRAKNFFFLESDDIRL